MALKAVVLFLEYAREVRVEVETALEGYAQFDDDCPARLREAIRHSLLAPGKRLRPMLVLMAAEACGCHRRRRCRRPWPSKWCTPIR